VLVVQGSKNEQEPGKHPVVGSTVIDPLNSSSLDPVDAAPLSQDSKYSACNVPDHVRTFHHLPPHAHPHMHTPELFWLVHRVSNTSSAGPWTTQQQTALKAKLGELSP